MTVAAWSHVYSVAHAVASATFTLAVMLHAVAQRVNIVTPAAAAMAFAGHCVLYGLQFEEVWRVCVKVGALMVMLYQLNWESKVSVMDENGGEPVETVETRAGIMSQLFFWWALPMIYLGYKKKELVMDDLVRVSTRNKPQVSYERFSGCMKSKKDESLIKILYAMNKESFWNCAAVLLLSTLFGYLSPVILQFLLNHVENSREDYMTGVILSLVLFASNVIQSVTEHQFWIIGVRCGMRCQTALMAHVYNKAFKMTNASLKKYSIGEIVNLMTVDACRISDSSVIQLFHWGTWCALLTLSISLVGLYGLLGYSMFFGCAIIGSFWPVSIYLSRKVKATSLEVQNRKDQRARYSGNAVGALRLIKSLQWEEYILKNIGIKRDAEIQSLVKRSIFGGIIDLWSSITQTAAPIGTFLIYSLIEEKPLTASVAFTSLTWFAMLNRALSIIPGGITALMDTLASIERLELFFSSPELQNNLISNVPSTNFTKDLPVIDISNAFFSWSEESEADNDVNCGEDESKNLLKNASMSINSVSVINQVNNINLSVRQGEMIFLVGPVGCGKSTLLASLMGETFLRSGKVHVHGRKAYVSHYPWFQNMSIRENIIFGKEFIQSKYDSVIDACMLVDDLNRMDDRDLSEVGEDGCNLSGGQKQRISLARALYADADIYLLDDVLSALDSNVGMFFAFKFLLIIPICFSHFSF